MQMTMVTDVQIDLYGEMQYYMASAKQGDRATRYIRVQLMNNGNEFQIPDDVQLIANIKKPDGKFCYNECGRENNRVMVQLTNQALAAAGTAYCDIEMRGSGGELILSSAAFTIEIERSMRDENAILSSNEMTFLDRKVQAYIDRMLATELQVLNTEEAVKLAEAARVLAEAGRREAEEIRKANELERIRLENERQKQESTRQQQESTRQQQERARQDDTAEAIRGAQEATGKADTAAGKCTDATGRAEKALKNEAQLEEAVNEAQSILGEVEKLYAGNIPVGKGGTGASSKPDARKALGITPFVVVGKDAVNANGFYKAFAVALGTWKTFALCMLVEPWNDINNPFRPLIVHMIVKSNSTGKYTPAVYLQSMIASAGSTLSNTREVLDNIFIAQLNSTPSGDVEVWFRQTKNQGPVRITVLGCAGRGITANDGLDSVRINAAAQTAAEEITPSLANVYSMASVLASNEATPSCEGLMGKEDKAKLDGFTGAGDAKTADFLDRYANDRLTSANIAPASAAEYGGMREDKMTASMKNVDGSGYYFDGHVLTFFWDNSGRYDTQLLLRNGSGAASDVKAAVRFKGNGSNFGEWMPLVTSNYTGEIAAVSAAAGKWKTARKINGLLVDGTKDMAGYGECATGAATAEKAVSCEGFSLVKGARIAVKFAATNTAGSPTLNVAGTGAKAVYYRGKAIDKGCIAAGRTYEFVYNGAQYDLVGDINTENSGVHVGTAAPSDTGSLWVDTGNSGILKYYNASGKKWTASPAVWG